VTRHQLRHLKAGQQAAQLADSARVEFRRGFIQQQSLGPPHMASAIDARFLSPRLSWMPQVCARLRGLRHQARPGLAPGSLPQGRRGCATHGQSSRMVGMKSGPRGSGRRRPAWHTPAARLLAKNADLPARAQQASTHHSSVLLPEPFARPGPPILPPQRGNSPRAAPDACHRNN
jgi:hypothetical protein